MAVAVSVQQWRDLHFLHWEVPPEALRALVPPELELDAFEGRTYVGVVPFLMRPARARFLPPLPGLADFYEVNVRTYVRHRGGEPGVWFFSLDASNLAAVLAYTRRSVRLNRARWSTSLLSAICSTPCGSHLAYALAR